MKLMIIESPGKIKKLSAILGPGWRVAASVGHVRDLPQKMSSQTQIVAGIEADFRPVYELTERGAAIVKKLKELVRQADCVYLATDPDREGESISWHLQQCLKVPKAFRVTFSEITASAVKTALLSPRAVDVKLVAAQEARRVLDRLVGYMVSPALSSQANARLSAGRVQSPAVRVIVERERQIASFKPVHHFGALVNFAGAKLESPWSAEWQKRPKFVTDEQPYFLNRSFSVEVSKVQKVIVTSVEESHAKRSPPAPFTTSTMQQAASIKLGLNPKAAMDAAQSLYEKGYITYHRTDNPNVSEESLGDIYAVVLQIGLDMADEPRKFKAPEGAQVGHPAITPTHWDIEDAGETSEEKALYRLIRLRAIACQLADAAYAVRQVRLSAANPVNGFDVEFLATGRTLVHNGWLRLVNGDQAEDSDEIAEPPNPIPLCRTGDTWEVQSGKLLEKTTKSPARYTQASLVKKLEAEGIGRPATYAAILENILNRAYIRQDKKFLMPTGLGELIVDTLSDHFKFMHLGFTREIEHDLDKIARGETNYKAIILKMFERLDKEISSLVKPISH